MSAQTTSRLQWLATAARVAVGCWFLYMGLQKASDPVGFLKLIRQYDLPFAFWLLNSIAAVLPWLEAFCGGLLALGVAVRGTALLLLAMLIPFTMAVTLRGLALAAARHLPFCAVRFDCGCGAGEVYLCAKLVENTLLTAACAWLVSGAGRCLALRYSTNRTGHPGRSFLPMN